MCRGKRCEKMKIIWNKFSPKKLWKIKLKLDDWINEGKFSNFFLFSLPRRFPFAFLSDKKQHEGKTQRRKVYVLCGKHIPREHPPAPPPSAFHKVYISIKDRWILSRQSEKYICQHFKNLAWYRVIIIYFGFYSNPLSVSPPHNSNISWLPHRSAHILLPSVRSELSK